MAKPKLLQMMENKSNTDSPSFSGVPIAPNPETTDNSTRIATTYFVNQKISNIPTTDTKNTAGSTNLSNTKLFLVGATSQTSSAQTYSNSSVYISTGNVLMGAAWNDYAEYRESDELEPGRVVCENGDGTLSRSRERLQPAAEVVSDTFGFAIGQTEKCQTPIAVSGRVLVFPYEDISTFGIGDAVCAAPNGTVSKMTREEIKEYPERIIGTVSEFPTYETWGESNIHVNGRFWIRIK